MWSQSCNHRSQKTEQCYFDMGDIRRRVKRKIWTTKPSLKSLANHYNELNLFSFEFQPFVRRSLQLQTSNTLGVIELKWLQFDGFTIKDGGWAIIELFKPEQLIPTDNLLLLLKLQWGIKIVMSLFVIHLKSSEANERDWFGPTNWALSEKNKSFQVPCFAGFWKIFSIKYGSLHHF